MICLVKLIKWKLNINSRAKLFNNPTRNSLVQICVVSFNNGDLCRYIADYKINALRPGDGNLWKNGSSLVQALACSRFGAKPLLESILGYCQLVPEKYISFFKSKFPFNGTYLDMPSTQWPLWLGLNCKHHHQNSLGFWCHFKYILNTDE